MQDIIAAARENNILLCPSGSDRVAYTSIEVFLSVTGKQQPKKAAKVRAAADRCAEKLQTIPDVSNQAKKAKLPQMWDSADRPTECCSLSSYLKNWPFSMGKLLEYARDQVVAAAPNRCPVFSSESIYAGIFYLENHLISSLNDYCKRKETPKNSYLDSS